MSTQLYSGTSEKDGKLIYDSSNKENAKSRTALNLCKNDDCENLRRSGSAYCQDCSDKHNKL